MFEEEPSDPFEELFAELNQPGAIYIDPYYGMYLDGVDVPDPRANPQVAAIDQEQLPNAMLPDQEVAEAPPEQEVGAVPPAQPGQDPPEQEVGAVPPAQPVVRPVMKTVATATMVNKRSHKFVDEVMRCCAQGKEALRRYLTTVLAFHGITLEPPPVKVKSNVKAQEDLPLGRTSAKSKVPTSATKSVEPGDNTRPEATGPSTSQEPDANATVGGPDADAAIGSPAQSVMKSKPVTPKTTEPRPSTSRQTRSQATGSGSDRFMENIQAEQPHPSSQKGISDAMQPVVRLENCEEAIRQARLLSKPSKSAPSTSKSKQYHSEKDRSKTVDAATAYGFLVQSRCSNEANPLSFCPYCFTWFANKDHYDRHSDVIDSKKLRAYCNGVFKSGLRGPLYRQDVVNAIEKWVKQGTLRNNISQVFAVVGVGLTDSRTMAMPLYNLEHCFKENMRPESTILHRALQQANVEMREDSDEEDDM